MLADPAMTHYIRQRGLKFRSFPLSRVYVYIRMESFCCAYRIMCVFAFTSCGEFFFSFLVLKRVRVDSLAFI